MLDELEAAIVQAERSVEVRVIRFETANEKAFCAGADIFVWRALSPLSMWSEWVHRATGSLIGSSAPASRSSAPSKAMPMGAAWNWPWPATCGSRRIRPALPCPKSRIAGGAVNAFSDDAKEGLAAFREKRLPQFESQ